MWTNLKFEDQLWLLDEVNAWMNDWVKSHPLSDDDLKIPGILCATINGVRDA